MQKLLEIKYTNSLDEIKLGFIKIHNKYMRKRNILFSVVYLIAVVLGVDMVIKNPSGYAGYILTALALAMVVLQWARPYMVRSRLIKTLSGLSEETYSAAFFEDRIEIETDIVEEAQTEIVAITTNGVESVENPAVINEAEKSSDLQKVNKTVINLATEELYSQEDEVMFRLFVNRALVYVFPKRCINENDIKTLHEYFEEKAI